MNEGIERGFFHIAACCKTAPLNLSYVDFDQTAASRRYMDAGECFLFCLDGVASRVLICVSR
jgi:hypothetical protein